MPRELVQYCLKIVFYLSHIRVNDMRDWVSESWVCDAHFLCILNYLPTLLFQFFLIFLLFSPMPVLNNWENKHWYLLSYCILYVSQVFDNNHIKLFLCNSVFIQKKSFETTLSIGEGNKILLHWHAIHVDKTCKLFNWPNCHRKKFWLPASYMETSSPLSISFSV